jgi:formate/nitrite transporter FocA (FNT family)
VLRGVFAGWLIALMVWMLPVARLSRITTVVIITYFVALGRFPHIIAESVEVLFLTASGQVGWGRYLTGCMLPRWPATSSAGWRWCRR